MSMRLSDYVGLAFQNLRRQKFRNLLAVSAIVIGASSITVMLSLVTGAKAFYYDQFKANGKLEQVLVNQQSDLSFEAAQRGSNCSNCPKLTDDLIKEITNIDHVVGVTPTVDVNIFESVSLDTMTESINSAQSYQSGGVIEPTLLAGRQLAETDTSGVILINQYLADKWGYKGSYNDIIGKTAQLTTSAFYTGEGAILPDPAEQFKECQNSSCSSKSLTAQLKPTTLKAEIVGVVANENIGMFLPLSWSQNLLKRRYYEISEENQIAYKKAFAAWDAKKRVGDEPMPEFTLVTEDQIAEQGYSTLVVAADSTEHADLVANKIKEHGVGAASVESYIKSELEVFDIVGLILGSMGGIALIVAAIGVVNTMVTAILERTREIGVMRAIGAKRSIVGRLFTIEASLLGFLGGLFGVILGYALIIVVNIVVNAQLQDSGIMSKNVIGLPIWVVLLVITSTTFIGTIAGLYPARRAARLDPVEALRHQ